MANDTAIDEQESQVVQAEQACGGRVYRPKVDIIETDDELLLLADVPGADAENIEINFEQGVLSVHARVNPRGEDDRTSYGVREYGVGDYARSFQIDEGINTEKIEAELNDGVLAIKLAKHAEAKPKRITVGNA